MIEIDSDHCSFVYLRLPPQTPNKGYKLIKITTFFIRMFFIVKVGLRNFYLFLSIYRAKWRDSTYCQNTSETQAWRLIHLEMCQCPYRHCARKVAALVWSCFNRHLSQLLCIFFILLKL